VSAFDRLHPALQHHIVNSLGWSSLRPTQLSAIDPILDGRHALLLAPTAGGKTEAAALPVLSRMLTERWSGLSVIYLCPLRALLNNLEPRLRYYAGLVGRSVAVWHGDISQGERRAALRQPPDILLTTPESLEAMLISLRVDHRVLFAELRTVVVDELHAFAGDDRGWHLLAVAERLGRIAGRPLQRIGLSATVGNPEELLTWLSRGEDGCVVGQPAPPAGGEITLDHVGSLDNAATVLSRIYRGEKRLVFCDSRSKVERLASALRAQGVNTFVSHSSLGIDERRRSEEAFATGDDCVIVATSTLELGIDVGDLDRVVQIDAPSTVSSFLQRMGRTGRRTGSKRNCLFLNTSDEAFLQAAGILRLWGDGWVEPVVPPAEPVHLFAQQVMALILQERGLPEGDWQTWVGRVFNMVPAKTVRTILAFMRETGVIVSDGGILGIGPRGEAEVGRRNFIELVSAFTTPLLLTVRHGATELGQVDPTSLSTPQGQPCTLSLAGRSWHVTATDWPRRLVWVEPSGEPGRSRWSGTSRALHHNLCRAIERVVTGEDIPAKLSKRGTERLDIVREVFAFCDGRSIPLVTDDRGSTRWWTFAGAAANSMLAGMMRTDGLHVQGSDDFTIRTGEVSLERAESMLRSTDLSCAMVHIDPCMTEDLKFASLLPPDLADATLVRRLEDRKGLSNTVFRPLKRVRVVTDGQE
jgi:ATP-dependent Lhr-like helicase